MASLPALQLGVQMCVLSCPVPQSPAVLLGLCPVPSPFGWIKGD